MDGDIFDIILAVALLTICWICR